MNDPWAFGWTQLLTILGLLITAVIAVAGFRTFGRWKREKIEEKRIDAAIEALALAHESKWIFDSIRSDMSFGYEWEDMKDRPHDRPEMRSQRGAFYATLKRMDRHAEFFDRVWKLQAKCTAIFGADMEETFLLLHKARREVAVSAQMLMDDPTPTTKSPENKDLWDNMRAAVWKSYGRLAKDGDKVGGMLTDFVQRIDLKCRPIVNREYNSKKV